MDRRREAACLGAAAVAYRVRDQAQRVHAEGAGDFRQHGQRRALLAFFQVGDACPAQAEPRGQLGLGHPALLPELADGTAEVLQEISRHANKPDLPPNRSQPS